MTRCCRHSAKPRKTDSGKHLNSGVIVYVNKYPDSTAAVLLIEISPVDNDAKTTYVSAKL
jgi:hypothetical protein